MAIPDPELIAALRRMVNKLNHGVNYQWGHMGSCNCGLLAQEITTFSKSEIHSYAMERYGDWSRQAEEYCPSSHLPIDLIIRTMMDAGLSKLDIKNLENLSDKAVLNKLSDNKKPLRHNVREDVISYLSAWIELLEEKLIHNISLSNLHDSFIESPRQEYVK